MKKQKVNLNDLKVVSFVTSLNQNESKTVNGGTNHINNETNLCNHTNLYFGCTQPGACKN